MKEKIRCAKNIEPKFIGILYERIKKSINDTAIIQSFLGRMAGYKDFNKDSVIYTNIDTIKRYVKWMEYVKKYDGEKLLSKLEKIKWNSNTTKTKNQKTINLNTYNM